MKKAKNKTIGEFTSLIDLLQAFPTEESCIAYLEKQLWGDGEPVSPYDPTSKVYRRGDGMYRCKNTGKNFNIRIGTIFEGSKVPLRKWFVEPPRARAILRLRRSCSAPSSATRPAT